MNGIRWSADKTAQLAELWADRKLTVDMIAGRLGTTRDAVANKAARDKLPRRGPAKGACVWSDEQVEVLTRLWLEGWSAGKIAEQIEGATRNSVIGKVNRLDLPPRRTKVRSRPGVEPQNKPRKSQAKPKAAKPLKRAPVPKPEPYAFTAGTWEPLAWATPVTLENVTGCRWPASDPFAPVGSVDLFCNCKALDGKSYCAEHQARSVGKGTPFERAAPKKADDAAKFERWVRPGSVMSAATASKLMEAA